MTVYAKIFIQSETSEPRLEGPFPYGDHIVEAKDGPEGATHEILHYYRYYAPEREFGGWPGVAYLFTLLMASPDVSGIWYYEAGQPPERLSVDRFMKITDHWIRNGQCKYYPAWYVGSGYEMRRVKREIPGWAGAHTVPSPYDSKDFT